MRRIATLSGVAAGLILLGSCGDGGPTGPGAAVPGVLDLRYSTPNGDDGAVFFDVAGGPVEAVLSTAFRVSSSGAGASEVRVIVTGPLAPGTVAQLRVPDLRRAADYTATIREVATEGTYALRDLQGYRIDVVRP